VNVFNGTTWDDKANPAGQVPYASNNGVATDHTYTTNVTATPLTPEEALAAFVGENPNGVWTLTISDDATGDGGSLALWSLTLVTSTCGPPPIPCAPSAPVTVTNSTPVAISTGAPAVVTSTITVAGAPAYLYNLKVITAITHTWCSDLDITLRSPAGTIVTLTTDNGGSLVNVFNGTTWDDKANPAGQVPYASNNGLAADHSYTSNVVATPLAPEEPLGAFIGENPNGVWTITISDDATGDGGSLASWSLVFSGLASAPIAAAPVTVTNNTPVAISTGAPAVVTSNITVAGAGTQLLNVKALTNITHTWGSDLDITLRSPAGTIVTLTTDNGGSLVNVFNGTTWDDKANPAGQVPYASNNGVATDHTYTSNVTATPLTPEEALAAFVGENPNGVWTLTISDDATGDGGSLDSWALTLVTSLCSVPACAITCPANITVNKQAGTCGATVTFPAPTTTGACGAVTVVPASGSVFPVGVTTVNASVAGVGGPTCSFTVTVVDTEVPSITTHPASRTNCEADNPTFTVVATNAVSYQWQVSAGGAFTNIQGATGATLTLTNVPLSANGFQYRVVVTGPCTPVTSNAATLTLNPLPTVGSITASPRSKLSPGQTTSLSLTTYNGFPGNFGWYRNNVLVQTTLTPNLNNLTIDSLGVYKLVFTDIKGCKATTTDFPLEAEPDFRFFVFPNPNNGHFQVRFYAYELGVKRTLSVFDSKGNLVFKREFIMTSPYEKMDVDVSRYTKGYYHVELRDNSGKYLGSGSALFIQ
jgi:subtilisin-like proprotein convertase family protein